MQSNKKNVFAAIAKTRLIGFSDKVESQTDKIDSLTDKNESRLGQIDIMINRKQLSVHPQLLDEIVSGFRDLYSYFD